MRLLLAVVISLSIFAQSHPPSPTSPKGQKPPSNETGSTQKSSSADQRGTDQSPITVKIVPSPKTKAESDEDANEREEKSSHDWWANFFTGLIAFIGIVQTAVFGIQAIKLNETVKSAGEQSAAMERHIGEVSRSATAMEDVVNTIREGNEGMLRAYLTVTIGMSIYQMRRVGQSDLRFETRPNLSNTGNTPARKVCILISADILPVPIPLDYVFPLPEESEIKDAGMVGAHQTATLSGTVDHFVPDADVAEIKEGTNRALYAWGSVTYEDIFGKTHETKFAQWIAWNPDGSTQGYYVPGQNDSQ